MTHPQDQYPSAQYQRVAIKARPAHGLHLALTVLTCGAWSGVWIVLAARYWGVTDYTDPAARPGMTRRTLIATAIIGAPPALILGLWVLGMVGALLTGQ